MNVGPDLVMWLTWLLRLGVGVFVVVAVTWLFARTLKSGVWQRTAWRGCFLALGLFVMMEFAGFGLVWQDRESAAMPVVLSAGPEVGAEGVNQADGDLVVVEAADPAGLAASAVRTTDNASSAVWWPGWVWLAGAFGWIGRNLIAGIFLALWRRRHCKHVGNGPVVERVRLVGQRLGLKRPPQILESAGIAGPAVVGFWRVKLLLPTHFAEDVEPAKQEVMLAHELAHIAGRDSLWHVFADFMTAVLWWQPLVWLARRSLRAASETAADGASCIVEGGPELLAACLIELGRKLTHVPRKRWLAMAGDGFRSGLGRRVERLLALEPSACRPVRRLRTCVFVTLFVVLLSTVAFFSTAWAHQPSFEGDSTMSEIPHWKRSLAGLVLCATFGTGLEAAAAPEERQAQPPGVAAELSEGSGGLPAEGSEFVLRVYRLKHRDPETLVKIASLLLEPPAAGPFAGGVFGEGAPGAGRGGAAGPGETGLGGGFSISLVRLAADKRTRTLIARGPANEIRLVSDLVTILDVQDGQAIPKLKNLRLFKLKHADPAEVVSVLAHLEVANFPARIAADPHTRGIIVMGEPAVMSEVSEVIQALDIEGEGKSKKSQKP